MTAMTVPKCCRLYGVSARTVYRWIALGWIDAHRSQYSSAGIYIITRLLSPADEKRLHKQRNHPARRHLS